MGADWKKLCGERNIRVDGDSLEVSFSEGRRHRIVISEHEDRYRLTAIVIRAAIVQGHDDIAIKTWYRNRSTALVGFHLDTNGRLVGEAWVPKAGLSGEEFRTYIYQVARECDHFEYVLTGKDET